MNKLARITSTLAALAALTAAAAPAAAAAREIPAAAAEAPRHGRGKARPHFPMDAARFSKRVDERIAKQRAKIEAKMEKRGVPVPRRAEVRKALDDLQGKVRAAVDRAAKDGVITQDEAKQVRELTRAARKAIAEQLGLEKKRDKKEKREKGTKRPARAQAV
ncbi:uncharacterized protein SOCE26_095060 [Sorangium cellulosum]|uniref:Secreted protein n=1 Tax=Sorangium cellulosum TaxID=56 RepID=A0A2L0F8U9_SORCE|nr:hypothetical protein [Sorangium cellulosum]AUX47980.1 uncharacterized protein SOCE26_095060 [Sorangium cellulosum]